MPRSILLLPALLLLGCPDSSLKDPGGTIPVDDTGTGGNHPPTAPEVVITPAAPADTHALTLVLVSPSTDPDGDGVTYRIAWARDGVVDPTLTTETVDAALTSPGETWTATLTPTDGAVEGPAGTASVVIGADLPPSAPAIHLEPVAPTAGDTLTLVVDTPAVDPEGAALTQHIAWYRNEVLYRDWADATRVDGAYVAAGDVYRVVVSVEDGVNAAVTAEASVVVDNQAPVFTSLAVAPAEPIDSETLHAEAEATDPEGADVTLSFAWYVDGVLAADVGDSRTVDADRTSPGEVWTLVVTADDGAASTTATADPVTIEYDHLFLRASRVELVVRDDDDDGTWDGLSGDWEAIWRTDSLAWGRNDCAALYALTADAPTPCEGCAFAFETTAVYDAAASSFGTPATCELLATDGLGDLSLDLGGPLYARLAGPVYAFYDYGMRPNALAEDLWIYGAYPTISVTYDYGTILSYVTTREDTAGDLHVTATYYANLHW